MWVQIGSIVLNAVLVLLFVTGGFFMTRSFLKKLKNQQQR